MHILVTHLTRMGSPYICAAGFKIAPSTKMDPASVREHIRPVDGQLHKDLLHIFQLGAIVDLGPTQHVGQPPETEDYSFQRSSASIISRIAQEEFWAILKHSAKNHLNSVFGSYAQKHSTSHGTGVVVNAGTGEGSLGELQVSNTPNLYVDDFGGLRIQIEDAQFAKLDLPVTDARFFEPADWSLRTELVNNVKQRLSTSSLSDIVLGVGLTRVYEGFHWLQVNNIHLKENPLWAGSLKR